VSMPTSQPPIGRVFRLIWERIVIGHGMRILFDPQDILKAAQKEVNNRM
jgi:hypothetical protein